MYRMGRMMRAMVVLMMLVATTGVAIADPRRVSLDPRIALAVEADDLMPPGDEPASVIMRPRPEIAITPAATPGHRRLWQVVDVTTLVTSNAMLLADAAFTHGAAARGWSGGSREVGMPAAAIMGATPSTRAVTAYFASAIGINTIAWLALPPRWRSILPGVIIGAQADALAFNYGLCRSC